MLCNELPFLSRRSSWLWSIYTRVSVLEAPGRTFLVLFWGACWLCVSISLFPLWMKLFLICSFQAAVNFVQCCEAALHTRKLHSPYWFLAHPSLFPLFKTYWGEGMRTVGLETSRLRPRLEVLVNFGLLLLLIFSAVVFDRSILIVDLLLMSINWARIFGTPVS